MRIPRYVAVVGIFFLVYLGLIVLNPLRSAFNKILDEKEYDDLKKEYDDLYIDGLEAVKLVRNEFPTISELNVFDIPELIESPEIFSSFHTVLYTPCDVRTAKEGRKKQIEFAHGLPKPTEQEKLFKALQSEVTDTPLIQPWKNLLKVSRNSSRSSDNEACEPTDISRAYTNTYTALQQETQVSPKEKLKQKIDALKKQRMGM